MDAAYDDQTCVDDRTIDSHVKRIRKKLRAVDEDFQAVQALYGSGKCHNDEMKIGIEVRAPSVRTMAERGPARLQLVLYHVGSAGRRGR